MFQPNAVIAGRYQVVRLVGQGGMSNLYLAYDRKYSNATVVVKEMTASYSDPKEQKMAVDLFHREAKLLASLNHRHIPKVFDYFQFAGKYYLSMEYIDGVDLAVKLDEKKGPLPEEKVLDWGQQIATVLFYLHKHDPPIVFRDVKPSNIMISSQGVKLIDFGIARHFDQAKKGDTMRIGSPGYAPPEQYTAQTDPRSDIYALGVTLHHALTGRDPTATSTPFLVPPARKLNPALSEETEAMLSRATQLDPDDRYQSALDLKKDIKQILSKNGQGTRVVGVAPTVQASSNLPAATSATPASQNSKNSSSTPPAAATSTTKNTTPATKNVSTAGNGSSQSSNSPASHSGQLASANPSNSKGNSPASGQLTAAHSSSTASQSPQQTSQTVSPKKKSLSFSKLLAAACLLIALGGAGALLLMEDSKRDALVSRVTSYCESLWNDLSNEKKPEDRLRESLLSRNPEALIPLFQSEDFKTLSEDKQELFRLNLLAASSSQGPFRMVNVLVPEGSDNSDLWEVSALVVRSTNSSGGLAKELLTVVPQTYPTDGLARTIQKLATHDEVNAQQTFLVLGDENIDLPEDLGAKVLFLRKTSKDSKTALAVLQGEKISYSDLFGLDLDPTPDPTVWGISGLVPDFALNSKETLSKAPDQATLKSLLERAQSANGRLILRAEEATALGDSGAEGNVLLLAATHQDLPGLSSEQSGKALVLSSPFETIETENALRPRPQSLAPLSLNKARLFDSIILAALPKNAEYQGLTVIQDSNGNYLKKSPTQYQWKDNSWLPMLKESGLAE